KMLSSNKMICGIKAGLLTAFKISPELLGVLSSIAAFMALMALFFLYLSNKLSVGSPDELSHLSSYRNTRPGTQHTHITSAVGLTPQVSSAGPGGPLTCTFWMFPAPTDLIQMIKLAEQGGYSSEASSEQANSIQRIKADSSLAELQPPPYQDKGPAACVSSRSRSDRGVRRGSSPPQRCDSPRCSSEASVEQDTESYINKGCEEDIPSDSTAVLGPDDGSGPHLPLAYEPEPLAKYGTLDVAFEYDSSEQWLAVTVTAATDIPALKQTGNISWQVHLVLLPTKKQRAKTGVQKGPCPVFTETFKFSRVEQDALGDYAVRFRLYSIRRMKKEKVLGEKVFYLTKLNLQGKIALPVTLEPGSELTGCGSLVSVSRSAGALSYRSTEDSSFPEILLGLIYNSATGRLSAEVIQGSHFKTTMSDKPVNTYVKLTMLDSKGKEMSKCKTAVCRGQPNPTYKETFMFQVALFQLSEVSLVVSVFCRRSSMRPRERLGWVSLGLNSTGEEQQAHWTEMKEAEGQQVCHWHTLTDT
uniref:Synaptotagmin XIVb n=1 Tax=Echeneis naucrates TaxID=173247 RepID=A0A665WP25_ECHNA